MPDTTPATGMSLAERETVFIWTVLTTRNDIMHTLNLSEEDVIARLEPLSLDPTLVASVVNKVYREHAAYAKVRSVLMTNAAIANDSGTRVPWDGSGVHPSITGLRITLGLSPATIDSDTPAVSSL